MPTEGTTLTYPIAETFSIIFLSEDKDILIAEIISIIYRWEDKNILNRWNIFHHLFKGRQGHPQPWNLFHYPLFKGQGHY